ncbi:MAG: hypothetical protein IJ019_01970 [Alphaproteobacteria bacterium]|nr:hypothetical protein [Alphaproteobacteria bacterium]
MYYKLLNKNVISAVLVSLLTIGVTDICQAQGVVSLVEEDAALPQDNTAEVVTQEDDFDEFGFEIDAEIPDTIEDEVIPLNEDALISPTSVEEEPLSTDNESVQVEQPSDETDAPQSVSAEDTSNLTDEKADNSSHNTNPEDVSESFDLGLDKQVTQEEIVKTDNVQNVATDKQNPLNVTLGNEIKPVQEQDFANSVLAKIDNDLFAQMSDIEKQTTLLTLELRREKIRNEIEAIKAQRVRAEEEKLASQKEKELMEIEKQKEQEAKVYKEKQILKDKEIELEKIKQRKALSLYMNKMLEDKQVWIDENAKLLKKIKELEADRNELVENFKKKLNVLDTLSNKFVQSANSAKNNHERTVASLTAQNIQLKKRLETEVEAMQNAQKDTLNYIESENIENQEENNINLSQEYAVLDIVGKGKELIAKLINKEGSVFSARKGTVLHSGYVVEQITPDYIIFSKQGMKQYLHTGTTVEPEQISSDSSVMEEEIEKDPEEKKAPVTIGDSSAPTLGAGMFVK